MDYPPYDDGRGLASAAEELQDQSQIGGASPALQASQLPLPPPGQLHEWLCAIVLRDGLEALLQELVRSIARDQLMETTERICNSDCGQ